MNLASKLVLKDDVRPFRGSSIYSFNEVNAMLGVVKRKLSASGSLPTLNMPRDHWQRGHLRRPSNALVN
jgi:hypothetical protein